MTTAITRPPASGGLRGVSTPFEMLSLLDDFDSAFEYLLNAKLVLSRFRPSSSQMAALIIEQRQTDLSLEHLAVKHKLCSFEQGLDVIKTRRRILELIPRPC